VHIRGSRLFEESVRNEKERIVAYRSVNPATGEVLKTFTEHTDEQMWSALAKSDKEFRTWASRPFSERSRIIAKSAQILLEQKEELARLATLEMGKRIAESRGEVELSASIMQHFADNAEVFLAPKKLNSAMGDARLFTLRRPSQHSALELSLLPASSLCRSPSDVRQRHSSQARPWRPPVRIGF
jgi:acyl-CoA reductase-like NAD-dependent aldehyde dehydrogenase